MKKLRAREERAPHGTYRPGLPLYWLGRLARPMVAEALRQHTHKESPAGQVRRCRHEIMRGHGHD